MNISINNVSMKKENRVSTVQAQDKYRELGQVVNVKQNELILQDSFLTQEITVGKAGWEQETWDCSATYY